MKNLGEDEGRRAYNHSSWGPCWCRSLGHMPRATGRALVKFVWNGGEAGGTVVMTRRGGGERD
jgi:hypothetical protein